MNLSHIRFYATDNVRLAGLLFAPKKATKKVALLLHGNGSSSIFESVEDNQSYAKALVKKGIAFFPFNNRGAGDLRGLKRVVNGKEERLNGGTAYELIKDCIKDIDGAIEKLKELGYNEFYLIGESTGANKIAVYDYYKKKNPVSKYILVSGGDDTGIYYDMLGKKTFLETVKQGEKEVKAGNGKTLIPKEYSDYILSWQSFYDTINPDGDYNIFPYNEYFNNLKLAKKDLFREFKNITKPTMVVYGANDEYCYGRIPEIIDLLEVLSNSKEYASIIISDADHGLTGKMDEAAKVIADWLSD